MTPSTRRIVTGLGSDGRSMIASDADVLAVMSRPGGATINEVWRVDELPADISDDGPLIATTVEAVAAAGLAIRVCTFPPDTAVGGEIRREYADSVASSYGTGPQVNGTELHRTNTVDVLTVIRGELTLVTEAGETVLRQGDTVVQRGTMHAWLNQTDEATVVLAVMVSAARDN